MKKFVWGALLAGMGLVGLFVSAGRGSGELRGYFRASADKTLMVWSRRSSRKSTTTGEPPGPRLACCKSWESQ